MVDFGNTLFEQNLGSEVPIVQPVQDRSSEYFAQGLKSGIDGLSSFMQLDAKNKSEQAKGALYQDITEKVSLLADARDQGKMSLTQANRQLRVWSNEWVSEAPSEADSIFTFLNKTTQDRGIGGSIYTETPSEAGDRKLLEQGAAFGWDVSTPEKAAEWKTFYSNTQLLDQKAKALENSNKLMTEGAKAGFIQQFQVTAASTLPWVQGKIQQANSLLQDVVDPTQRQAIIDQLKTEVSGQSAMLSTLGANAGADKLDYLLNPINKLVEQFESTASGKSTQQALETQAARTKAQMELLMFSDPQSGKLFITNAVSQYTDPYAIAQLDAAKLKFAAGLNVEVTRRDDGSIFLSEKPTDIIDTPEKMAVVLDLDRKTIETMLQVPDLPPEAKQAMSDKLAVALEAVRKYGATEENATMFTTAVNYFADTSVGQWMEQNYTDVGPKIASDAAYVVERQYSDVVLKLVNERWLEANDSMSKLFNEQKDIAARMNGGDPASSDLTKFIEPTWNGYGVEFKVNDEYKDDPTLQGLAKELNQGKNSVAGPINKLVRMSAHLSGTTDYEKVYNEQFATRLWVTGEGANPAKPDKNETLDSLTNIPEAALKGTLQQVPTPKGLEYMPSSARGQVGQLLDAIGQAEGANYTTLYGYAEQPGKSFAGTNITDMTIDEVQALQKLMVKDNKISSAVGKYQFIQKTLARAIDGLGLSKDTKFTPEVQDKLAVWLLQNATSFSDWVLGNGDSAKFQNELASQWASIPNTTGRSTYADDGINNSSAAGQRLVGLL